MSLYVETRIRADVDELWKRTQRPELHERWDLRFTSIEYLPRDNDSEPQRFRYSTRLGFGLAIDGEGETVATRCDDGSRTSSLRFASDDPKSLIREGAGYWQYISADDGIRFITGYDYKTRFGWLGRMFDRVVFRPLMGWATAWSFDRLRLWIEKGIDPAVSMQRSLVHFISRVAVAFVWIYQGLVPKLIARHADELAMFVDAGIPPATSLSVLMAIGIAEVVFGVGVLVFFRHRWPLMVTIWVMIVAIVGVIISSPRFLVAAFNPVSLNLLVAAMSLIGLLVINDLPSARKCLRKKPEAS